jgi:hypothetical protein
VKIAARPTTRTPSMSFLSKSGLKCVILLTNLIKRLRERVVFF